MRTFSIGIVGAGNVTRQMHLPVLLSMPNVRIAWIGDAEAGRASELAHAYRIPALKECTPQTLPKCDVVLLAIPTGVRESYYLGLAKSGTAVFAEKPFALTHADHARFTALFPAHATCCGYMRRTYESNTLLRKLFVEQWFGVAQRIVVREGARMTKTHADSLYYDNPKVSGGGVLMIQGTHSVDQALFVSNAAGVRVLQRQADMDGPIDRRVEGVADLLDERGERFCELNYRVSWIDAQENTFEIEFERAVVSTGMMPNSPVKVLGKEDRQMRGTIVSVERGPRTPNQAFFAEWDLFLRGLEEGQPTILAAQHCALTARLIDGLYGRGGGDS